MATIPIHSPVIPFLGLIPGGLSHGRMLRIKGIITKHGERCQIHIQSGAALSPRDDVTLHISIRPNEYAIVRNTINNQVVGPEERHGGCPVRYGEPFDLLILAEGGQYKIAFNGVHFCTFAHRLPLHHGRYIAISGGCVIYSILSEHDQPGSSSYQPNIPSSYPHSIGFAPPPPPSMPMAPPPPYTPLPTHPIGGGGGHYKDLYPPPPPPPMTGYPHHPAPYQPAVPFSVQPHIPPTSKGSKTVKMKEMLAGGINQTQHLIRNAMGRASDHPTHPVPSTPASPWVHNDQQTADQSGWVMVPPSVPAGGGRNPQPYHPWAQPYPTTEGQSAWVMVPPLVPAGGGQNSQPYHPWGQPYPTTIGHQQQATSGSGFPMAGTDATILSQSLSKRKQKKLLKYGAAAGIAGLGGYALAKGIRRKGSSSSSSDSD